MKESEMTKRSSLLGSTAGLTICVLSAAAVRAECPLDHYFVLQEDGRLSVDKCRIYRHGDPPEGYYPMSWSPIYGCWSFGEPGFSDTTDPAYGFPPDVELEGTPNVDYQIWFEIVDISPDLYIQADDGTWLHEVGDRYNLSSWTEHHVHLRYRAYVPQDPPPDYPFYVTYRLVDEIGPYGSTSPFSVVFNVPAAAVEETAPPYRGRLDGVTSAEITLSFHRAVMVGDGPPVTITDEETHTHDYYTGYFEHGVPPDGMTLVLSQVGPALPEGVWLEIALTPHLLDAAEQRPAIPYTLYVATPLPGDVDFDGDVDLTDLALLLADYGCAGDDCAGDIDHDGVTDLSDLATLLGHYGEGT
jgi:hypothetical protein